jgi:hypothetical protein
MQTKHTLHLSQKMPFASCPPFVELAEDAILTNDVQMPWDRHPHGMGCWVIGHTYGAVCAVWANNEQDALDAAMDAGKLDCFLVSDDDQASATEDDHERWAHLGNADEPCNLDDCWMGQVSWDEARDVRVLCALAAARGAGQETLES